MEFILKFQKISLAKSYKGEKISRSVGPSRPINWWLKIRKLKP
jgi:hypothetical protein